MTQTLGYYNTVEQTLKGIMRHHTVTCDKELTSLKEYRNELQFVINEFNEKLKLGE